MMHFPNTLEVVQEQLKEWQQHNFPNREAWEPMVGTTEEVGELTEHLDLEDSDPHIKALVQTLGKLNHHFLKRHQGIRRTEDHTAGIKDAMADTIIYLCDLANAEGIDLSHEVASTWAQVQKRDWAKHRAEHGIEG